MVQQKNVEPVMVKVVARYPDGRVVKGLTGDFSQYKDHFHVHDVNDPEAPPRQVRIADLKAVFFVKDLAGDMGHAKSNIFDPYDRTPGQKIRINFKDGEELRGFSPDYLPSKAAFFVLPADLRGNIDRCYVVAAATQKVTIIYTSQ
jgi:hypothetical protein